MAVNKFARCFHALGLHTFPVRYVKNRNTGKYIKRPVGAWRDVPLGDAATHHPNYGVRLSANILVVDVDVKNGKQGAASWLKLRSELDDPSWLDKTQRLICGTMTGGKHHFFMLPDGVSITKKHPDYPDIDFLSEGAYIVGPGTNFQTGLPYSILQGAIEESFIPPAPREWRVKLLKRETEHRLPDKDFTNAPGALAQFRIYCQTGPVAIEGVRGDETTLKIALIARDLGIDTDNCLKIMFETYNPRCQPPWEYSDLETKVVNAYTYGKHGIGSQDFSHLADHFTDDCKDEMEVSLAAEGYKWRLGKNGMPVTDDVNNTTCYLVVPPKGEFENEVWGIYRYNAFTHEPEYCVPPPWYNPHVSSLLVGEDSGPLSDYEVSALKHYLFQKYGYSASVKTIREAILFVARQTVYHPVRSWLRSLTWDGVPRLDNWLIDYAGARRERYSQLVASKTLIGAVQRIIEPGCKMDYMLVLEGEQGSGKSTLCQVLAVQPQWYAGLEPDTGKDAKMTLGQKWIIEFAEVDALKERGPSAVKSFLASSVDNFRPPYAARTADYPRQSIFIGTVNPGASGQYLNDATGGRRYWPVRTGVIDIQGVREALPQLYAEAMHRYLGGERPYVDRAFETIMAQAVALRYEVSPIQDTLARYFSRRKDHGPVTLMFLVTNVLGITSERYDARAKRAVMNALTAMGYRVGGRDRMTVYAPASAKAIPALPRACSRLGQALAGIQNTIDTPRTLTLTEVCELAGIVASRSTRMALRGVALNCIGVDPCEGGVIVHPLEKVSYDV